MSDADEKRSALALALMFADYAAGDGMAIKMHGDWVDAGDTVMALMKAFDLDPDGRNDWWDDVAQKALEGNK